MKEITKVFGKLFQYAGVFRITIMLSAVFAASAAVINLKAYICVYGVAKLLIESGGSFQTLDLLELSSLGKQAVFYVGMGFGVYGSTFVFPHQRVSYRGENPRAADPASRRTATWLSYAASEWRTAESH